MYAGSEWANLAGISRGCTIKTRAGRRRNGDVGAGCWMPDEARDRGNEGRRVARLGIGGDDVVQDDEQVQLCVYSVVRKRLRDVSAAGEMT